MASPFQRATGGKRAGMKPGGIPTVQPPERVTASREIVIIDKEQKTTALMDVAVPSDDDFSKKSEKKNKD